MTKDKLKTLIINMTPFESIELTEYLFDTIIMRSLLVINKYIPHKFITKDVPNKDLGIHLNPIAVDVIVWEYEFDVVPYTLDTIESSPIYDHFLSLVEGYTYMYVSNKRRIMSTTDMFYDLKGDDFFNYGKELVQTTIQFIENSIDGLRG